MICHCDFLVPIKNEFFRRVKPKMLFYLGLGAWVNGGTGRERCINRIFAPKLARPLDLAMIAVAGFVIVVVPVVLNATRFTVHSLLNKPADWAREQDPEIRSPAIRILPVE